MNACPDGEILSAYLDGELAPAQSKEVRAHIDGCAACSKATMEFRVVTEGVRAAYQRQTGEGEWQAVWKRLHEKPPVAVEVPGRAWRMTARLAVLAAAAAVVAAIVLWPRSINETPPINLAMTANANGLIPVEEVQVFDGSTAVLLDYPDEGVSLVWFVSPQAPSGG
ncbi:MAG: zf-HC2 domain-containing protein [Planctomycetota bacterium]